MNPMMGSFCLGYVPVKIEININSGRMLNMLSLARGWQAEGIVCSVFAEETGSHVLVCLSLRD